MPENIDKSLFFFEGFTLDPVRRELRDGDGALVPTTGRVFEALACFVNNPGQLLTKDQLLHDLWPDAVVEENNLNQVISALRKTLGDDHHAPRFVKTIPGRGYQFVADVRIVDPSDDRKPAQTPRSSNAVRYWALGATCLLAALFLGVVIWSDAPLSTHEPEPGSVAVLPLTNLSPLEEDAFFALGLHDEIIHQLSRQEGLRVVPRSSVMRFADTELGIEDIAAALRVSTILAGSVRYADDQVRVTLQLSNGADGSHLWSQTYTEDFDDIFEIEQDISLEVARTLGRNLGADRVVVSPPPTQSAAAYVAYLRAKSILPDPTPATSPARSDRYQAMLDDALREDPAFAQVYALKAVDHATALMRAPERASPAKRAARIAAANENIQAALGLDPDLALAHSAQARLFEVTYRAEEAWRHYERAYALDPRDRDMLIDFSAFAYRYGRWPRFRTLTDALEKVDPGALLISVNRFILGDYETATRQIQTHLERIPLAAELYLWLSMSLLQEERLDEARASINLGQQIFEDRPWIKDVDLALQAYAFGRLDEADRARSIHEQLLTRAAERDVADLLLAVSALGAGQTQDSVEYFERAAADRGERDFALQFRIKHNIFRDPVLETEPFVGLRGRLGFQVPPSRSD